MLQQIKAASKSLVFTSREAAWSCRTVGREKKPEGLMDFGKLELHYWFCFELFFAKHEYF